nr:PAS domain S-box protein [Methanocalculus taiwanensis]
MIYTSDEEHRKVITAYLRHGLTTNQKVIYIVDERTNEQILRYLRDDGLDPKPYLESGQLEILDAQESYLKGGTFDPEAMIRLLSALTDAALAEGYSALRVTGEMTWALRDLPGTDRLIEYENLLNTFLPENSCIGICQYDRRRFPPDALVDVILTHPFMIIGGEVFHNAYSIEPHRFGDIDRKSHFLDQWIHNLQINRRLLTSLEHERQVAETYLDIAGVMMVALDPQGTILLANQKTAEVLGIPEEDLIGRNWFATAIPDRMRDEVRNVHSMIIRGEAPDLEYFDNPVITSSGVERIIAWHNVLLRNEDGNVAGSLSSGEDVTELRNAEAEKAKEHDDLLESEHRLSDIINFLPDATFAIDENGVVIAWNHAIEEMTGVSAEEMIGQGEYAYAIPFYGERRSMLIDLAFKDDLELRSRYDLLKEMPGAIEAETRYARPRGEGRTLWTRVSPLYNRKGEYTGAIETIRDITGRKNREEALERSEHLQKLILAAVPDILIRCTAEGRYLDILTPDDDRLVLPRDEVIGKTVAEVTSEEIGGRIVSAIALTLETGDLQTIEYALSVPAGYRYFEARISPYATDEVIALIRDITDRKEAEDALRERIKELSCLYRISAAMEHFNLSETEVLRKILEIIPEGFQLPEKTHVRITINDSIYKDPGFVLTNCSLVREIPIHQQAGGTITVCFDDEYSPLTEESAMLRIIAEQIGRYIERIRNNALLEKNNLELAEERSRLLNIIEGTQAGTWEWNVETGETVFNEEWARMLGYTLDELSPVSIATWQDLAEPGDLESAGTLLQKHFAGDLPYYECEMRMRHKDGGWIWIQDRGRVISRADDGRPLMMFGIHLDITDRKIAEEELRQRNEELATAEEELRSQLDELVATQQQLRESEEYIRTVLDNLPIGVAVNSVDPEVNFEYFNENFFRIYRTTAESLKSPDAFWDVVYEDPVFRSELRERVLADVLSGDPERMHWEDIPITREGEKTTYISARNIPVPGKDLWISTVWDVTGRVEAEREIQHRLAFESVISGISSRFVTESDIDIAINKALGDIGEYCGASRSYVFLIAPSGEEMSNTHEWCADGVPPTIETLQKNPTNLFPWWMERLRNGESIRIQSLDDLPPEAAAERQILEPQGVTSLIVLPLLIRSGLAGFIGFDNVGETRDWTDEDFHLLSITSELFGTAFEQKQAEDRILLHIRRTEALLDLHRIAGSTEQELMDYALDASLLMTKSQYAFIGLMNDDESVMTVHAWSDDAMKECTVGDKTIRFPIESSGVFGECVRTRTPTIINDYATPHPAKHGLPEGHVPITRYLGVPIQHGSRIVAVLAVANKEDEYQDDDVSALATLGNLMGELIFRQRTEASLKESEERYRFISTIITDFAYSCQKEDGGMYQIDWMAGATWQITGYGIDEVIAEGCWGFMIHPDDWQIFEENVLLLPVGESSECDLRIIRKDGKIRWLSAETRCIRDETGRSRVYGGCRDITEEKTARLELELNQERLELAMETGGIAWWEMDCMTGNIAISPQKAEMLGYSPDQFSHYTDFTALLHPDDHEKAMQAMRDHMEGRKQRYEVEYRIKHSAGAYLWFRDIGSVTERGEGGAPLKVVGLVVNITVLKEAEMALRESEKRFRTLFMESPVSIIIHDRDTGEIIDANRKACSSYGFSSVEELKAHDFWLESPYSFKEALNSIRKTVSEGPQEFEWLNRTVTGDLFWEYVRLISVVISGVERILATSIDITARKLAEEELRKSEALLSTAGRMTHFGGWSVNLDENRVIWSDEVARIHGMEPGYSPSVDEGISFYAPEWREKITRVFGDCARDGTPYDEEMEIITAGGERRWVRATGEATTNEYGRIIGVHGAFQDITQRKEAEEAWKKAYTQIEDNMVKFSILNDQIRNPLAIIMALADLEGGESAEKIIMQVKAIDRIITLLDQGVLESEPVRKFMSRHDQLSD